MKIVSISILIVHFRILNKVIFVTKHLLFFWQEKRFNNPWNIGRHNKQIIIGMIRVSHFFVSKSRLLWGSDQLKCKFGSFDQKKIKYLEVTYGNML